MTGSRRNWEPGQPTAAHPVLSGWIRALAPVDTGVAGRPGVVAASNGGDIALLGLPGGTVTGGPWPHTLVDVVASTRNLGVPLVIAVVGAGYLVRIDPATGRFTRLGGYTRRRRHLVSLPLPGEPLVALGSSTGVEIWSLEDGADGPLLEVPAGRGFVSALGAADLAGGGLLAAGTTGGQVTVWRVERPNAALSGVPRIEELTGQRLDVPPDVPLDVERPTSGGYTAGQESPEVSVLSVAEIGGVPVVVAGAGRTVQGWALTGEPVVGPLVTDHREEVRAVLTDELDGKPLLWTTDGYTARVWDTATGTSPLPAYELVEYGTEAVMRSLMVRFDGRILVVNGGGNGVVRVLDPVGSGVAESVPVAPSWDNSRHYPRRVGVATAGGRQVAVAGFSDDKVRAFSLADGTDVPLPSPPAAGRPAPRSGGSTGYGRSAEGRHQLVVDQA